MGSVIALDFVSRKVTRSPAGAETALYQDLRTDTLYKVIGTTVLPLFEAAHQLATYRTGVFVLDAQPSFAWLRLEGPVVSAVAKVYGDGALAYTTPTITGNTPVRLPAKRFREWEVEVISDGRVTDVTLASSTAELL